jgi:hypothetical protein
MWVAQGTVRRRGVIVRQALCWVYMCPNKPTTKMRIPPAGSNPKEVFVAFLAWLADVN